MNEHGSSVDVATGYGLDGPGIEFRWGRDFPHLSRPALGPTQLPVQWVPGLSRGKERPGRDADPSPPSSAVVMKGYSYTSTPPMGRTACTEPQCLYKGDLYLFYRTLWTRYFGNSEYPTCHSCQGAGTRAILKTFYCVLLPIWTIYVKYETQYVSSGYMCWV